MSGRRAKADRKIVNEAARHALETMRGPHNAVVVNEQDTRDRVTDLETWAQTFSNLTLRQRFRWLLKGR